MKFADYEKIKKRRIKLKLDIIDVKRYFDNEINTESFDDDLLELILLYKLKCNNVSLLFKERKLSLCIANDLYEDDYVNSIILGGTSIYVNKNSYKQDISLFLNQHKDIFNAQLDVFVDEDRRCAQIAFKEQDGNSSVFESYSAKQIIMMIIPRLLPWYFKDLPAEIIKLIPNIKTGNMDGLKKQLQEMLEIEGIEKAILLDKLKHMSHDLTQNRIEELNNCIISIENDIESKLRSISIRSSELREKRILKQAIEMNSKEISEPILELVDFLQNTTENIDIVKVQDGHLYLLIKTTMSVFEDSEYEGYVINNIGDSYLFDVSSYGYNKENGIEPLRNLYKAIFETRKITVDFATEIGINLTNGGVSKSSYEIHHLKNCIKHPHLASNFFCLGNNAEYISQFIVENRLVEAINCILYASKQFTIGDAGAGVNFVHDIFTSKALKLPNGEFVDALEAIEYINEHEEEF